MATLYSDITNAADSESPGNAHFVLYGATEIQFICTIQVWDASNEITDVKWYKGTDPQTDNEVPNGGRYKLAVVLLEWYLELENDQVIGDLSDVMRQYEVQYRNDNANGFTLRIILSNPQLN